MHLITKVKVIKPRVSFQSPCDLPPPGPFNRKEHSAFGFHSILFCQFFSCLLGPSLKFASPTLHCPLSQTLSIGSVSFSLLSTCYHLLSIDHMTDLNCSVELPVWLSCILLTAWAFLWKEPSETELISLLHTWSFSCVLQFNEWH